MSSGFGWRCRVFDSLSPRRCEGEEDEEEEPASSSTARASRLAGPDTLPQPQLRPDADSQGRFISMEAIWKPWQEGYQTVSTELVELVQCATRASRLAHGDLIWFGYHCGDEKQKGPNDKIALLAARALCSQCELPSACIRVCKG